jgi:hypothetical protein
MAALVEEYEKQSAAVSRKFKALERDFSPGLQIWPEKLNRAPRFYSKLSKQDFLNNT